MFVRDFKFIGELPDGYEYKLFQTDEWLKVIGVSLDKEPIAFIVHEDRLEKIEL
jgi:hypothetical protein